MRALVDELAGHREDPAVRIRLAQALVELPGPGAEEALRHLTRDRDPTVALVASAFVRLLAERSADERATGAD